MQNEIVCFLLESGHDEKELSKVSRLLLGRILCSGCSDEIVQDFANNTALMVAANYKNEEAGASLFVAVDGIDRAF